MCELFCFAMISCLHELEALWSFLDPAVDNFSWISEVDFDRILGAARTINCLLEPCPLWLVCASREGKDIIHLISWFTGLSRGFKRGSGNTALKKNDHWILLICPITTQF